MRQLPGRGHEAARPAQLLCTEATVGLLRSAGHEGRLIDHGLFTLSQEEEVGLNPTERILQWVGVDCPYADSAPAARRTTASRVCRRPRILTLRTRHGACAACASICISTN